VAPFIAAPVAPSSSGLSGGAIAGIVIGSVAGVALIAAALFFFMSGGGAAGGPGLVAVSAPVPPAPVGATEPFAPVAPRVM
jgi:hypothetical protein